VIFTRSNATPYELAADVGVEPRVRVAGDDHVDGGVHLARLVDHLASGVVALLEGARVSQDDDRLDALALQLGHVAVDGVRQVGPAELARVLGEQEVRRVGGRDPDEADLHAVALDDLVGRQDQVAAVPGDGVGTDVGVARQLRQPQRLGAALVELVVAERADVEAHQVGRLDRGLVVPVARDEGGGADHVARVDADRALRMRGRRAVEPRAQPRCSAHVRLRRLEVAVEVVHPQQLQLNGARASGRARLVGARVEAEQRNEKSGGKGGRPGQQVTAVDAWHGCKVCAICRRFVAESCQ
jgi:hypothetical protein